MGTMYAWTRKPAQSMLHTKEHYVCLQGAVYIVSQQAVNRLTQNCIFICQALAALLNQ